MTREGERARLDAAELQMLLTGLLDEAPVGVSVLDQSSVFLYVNDAMAGLHGVDLDDHVGRPLAAVLPGVAPAIAEALAAALVDGTVTHEIAVEGPSPHDPSSSGHWRMSVSPWRDDTGSIVGASVVARDVTAATRIELLNARSRERQARQLADERSFSRALQDAMLTRLPEPDRLEVRARYLPASQAAAVGGDWYDAVLNSDGALSVIIGDVSGHDGSAAASMGQLRGVLRAYVWDREEAPGDSIRRLERAQSGLQLDVLATLIVGRIDQPAQDEANGLRRLTWSNAGHPPPLLMLPGGEVRILGTPPEVLVGLGEPATRVSHEIQLVPGSTLLFYTDGLVERRNRDIDDGIASLQSALAGRSRDRLDEILDGLLDAFGVAGNEDDVALLAIRLHDEAGQ